MLKLFSSFGVRCCALAFLATPLAVAAASVESGSGSVVQSVLMPGSAAEEKSATEALTRKLDKIHTISARFQQEAVGSDGRTRTESGSMQMKRPGQFRWNTESPFEQEIVAIKDKVWLVDRDLSQVIIQHQDNQMGNTPAQLLSGNAREFLGDYRVFRFNNEKQDKFTLIPRENSGLFDKLDITFCDDNLDSIELRDSLGGRRRVSFSQVNVNGFISDSDFKIDIPKGYDVIDQTQDNSK